MPFKIDKLDKMYNKQFYTGIVIWLIAVVIAYGMWFGDDRIIMYVEKTSFNIVMTLSFYLIFLVGYFISTEKIVVFGGSHTSKVAGLCLSLVATVALSLCFFYGMISLLVTIIVSQFSMYLSQNKALIIAILLPVLGVFLDFSMGKAFEYPIISYPTILIFGLFNIFSLVTHYHLIEEAKAKTQSEHLLRELSATQALLKATTKRNERLRIARDLHDSLGHKLAALSLQLEVASHVTDESKQQHLQTAKSISQSILTTVRETVSENRDKNNLELGVILKKLIEDIPQLKVSLAIDKKLNNIQAFQVEILFRCVQEAITNTIKHSNATHCRIHIFTLENRIILNISDNGLNNTPYKAGNGLSGMAERVSQVKGSLEYEMSSQGFNIAVKLPIDI